jgi:hypothetical protein
VVAVVIAGVVADGGVFVLFAFVRGLRTRDSRSLIAFKD